MLSALYNITIYPIRQIIEFFYVLFSVASKNQGISVIGVSLVFTLLCLPLYVVAEHWQEIERETQLGMKSQISRIKKAFKGDEQYMMLTTYYRQRHYHPLMALRSSFGLLIQIPFFIAAYSFLSHLQQLQGASFLFIKDMGSPDTIFRIGSFPVNILPLAMTAINIVSGLIYSKGHEAREKIQIFVSAGIFLVLLYNMPAGLVLYWTMNNIFSTLKNICYKLPKNLMLRGAYAVAVAVYLLAVSYLLFVHTGNFENRLLLACAGLWIPLAPILIRFGKRVITYFSIADEKTRLQLFLLSCTVVCIMAGFALPSFVVASSPAEFSNIDGYGSPLFFLRNTTTQAMGFCLFWPICLYFLFKTAGGTRTQNAFAQIAMLAVVGALINAFLFSGDYGNLSSSLTFDSKPDTIPLFAAVNLGALLLGTGAVGLIIKTARFKFFAAVLSILALALVTISVINAANIQKVYKTLKPTAQLAENEVSPIYSLSKTKRNIVVIFLDRFTSSLFPEIIQESPELKSVYSGFTYFPNTISYGLHTIVGAPAMLGGYDYRPEQTNARKNEPLQQKINEGNSTLPLLFSKRGFEVTVANPADAETERGFYERYPEIKTPNTNGTYRKVWYTRHGNTMMPVKSTLIKRNFLWFSFFKCAPVITRRTIYKRNWWSSQNLQDTDNFVDAYSALELLPELTDCASEGDTFTFIHNLLPHEPMYLDAPTYTFPKDSDNISLSKSAFGGLPDFYSAAASIHRVGEWLSYLKEAGVYDNTRIIIASDHGVLIRTGVFKDNDVCQVEGCNPLLLFKDFGEGEELKTDSRFMTQCDIPALATRSLPENEADGLALHPWTHKPIDMSGKAGNQHLFMNHNNTLQKNGTYSYSAKPSEWYTVHDDIFVPENWSRGIVE